MVIASQAEDVFIEPPRTDTPFITPHPKQLKYINEKPQAHVRLALAGRQGGKTEIACIAFANELKTSRNEVFMVIAPTYKILYQATMVKLWEILHKLNPNFVVKKNETHQMYWKDLFGNIIFFRSTEKPDTLRGPTLKAALYDEAAMTPTGVAYRILRPALAVKGGNLWIATTPKGPNWILQLLIKPWKAGDPNFHVVTWRSIDNPAFPISEYEEALKWQDERWVKQEYDAVISDVGGLVFPEFNEADHVGLPEFNEKLPIYWGVDFGIANPTYIGYWQFDPKGGETDPKTNLPEGHHFMIDEFQLANYKFEDVLEFAFEKTYLKNKVPTLYPKPIRAACDPSGKYREKIAGVGTIDIMYDYGLNPYYQKDWNTQIVRMRGINILHRLLKKKMVTYHRDNCYNILKAFPLYSRKPQKEGERAEEMPIKDGIADHPMEAGFYHMLDLPIELKEEGPYIHDSYEASSESSGF